MDEIGGIVGERLADAIYAQLHQDILFGLYEPDEKLRLEGLRSRYEGSANTIREALARLVSDGLVIAEGQRGFSVAPCSPSDLRDITETRILLENQAARQSLEVADIHWEGEVVAAHHRLARAEELANQDHRKHWELLEQYDYAFHRTIIAGCASQWIQRFHAVMYDHMLRYRSLALKTVDEGELAKMLLRSQHDHMTLRDAALAKQTGRLVSLLESHIRKGEEFARQYNPDA